MVCKITDICIEQLALLETHYLVARMVQRFESIESQDERAWTELFALATTCRYGAKVKLNWARMKQ